MNKKTEVKKENLGKYFLLGTVAAAVLFVIFSVVRNDEPGTDGPVTHVWSEEMDSAFVKECYSKYKWQVKDLVQQESMKSFCRCMLSKMKTKYGEDEADRMTNIEIKQWDAECRNQLLNPNNLK